MKGKKIKWLNVHFELKLNLECLSIVQNEFLSFVWENSNHMDICRHALEWDRSNMGWRAVPWINKPCSPCSES